MTKRQAWFKAFRLRTLPLSLSGIILGSGIARYNGFWNWSVFSFALITTILFQILSNLANDLGDSMKGTDNEHRVGPMRSVQSGMISQREMTIAVIITAILSCISAGMLIFLGTRDLGISMIWFYSGLALACIVAAITYTVGKKAYGYNGFGDLMVFLFFGLVSVMGVYPLFAKTIDLWIFLPASSIGLLSVAVLNLNNMRDRVNDARSNKRTLVVIMGPNLAKLYHVLLVLGGMVCQTIFLVHTGNEKALIGMVPSLVLAFHVRKVMQTTDPKDFDPELKKVALSTFGIAVLSFVGLLL